MTLKRIVKADTLTFKALEETDTLNTDTLADLHNLPYLWEPQAMWLCTHHLFKMPNNAAKTMLVNTRPIPTYNAAPAGSSPRNTRLMMSRDDSTNKPVCHTLVFT